MADGTKSMTCLASPHDPVEKNLVCDFSVKHSDLKIEKQEITTGKIYLWCFYGDNVNAYY